jgi:hypothetical protein
VVHHRIGTSMHVFVGSWVEQVAAVATKGAAYSALCIEHGANVLVRRSFDCRPIGRCDERATGICLD